LRREGANAEPRKALNIHAARRVTIHAICIHSPLK